MNKDILTREKLEFVIFCIENVAARLGVSGNQIYDALIEKSQILYEYVVPAYEPLHTQSKEYIVDDIIRVMQEQGVNL